MPIELLSVGDEVIGYNEDEQPEIASVKKVWDNGIQVVIPLISSGKEYVSGTETHKLLACNEAFFDKRRPHLIKKYSYRGTKISSITERHRVKRIYVSDLIQGGAKNVKHTYILGALIGDGCSKNNKTVNGLYQKYLYISSDNDIVPAYIAHQLGCSFERPKHNNHTHKIKYGKGVLDAVPFYKEWVSGRGAHEKIALWSEVDTWDKETALSFLAGIVDTDGSIYYKSNEKKEALINISMQSKSVVDVCAKIIFKYFQEEFSIHIDNRPKYKNGCVYSAKTTSNLQLINILKELNIYLVKKKDFDISTLNIRNVLPDRIGFNKAVPYLTKTYDIAVNNKTNLYILHKGGIVTSNSGKTERAKRKVVTEAMKIPGLYFCAAPVRHQAKDLFWKDLKLMIPDWFSARKPSESELIIFLKNGSEIQVLGLDKAERIEGRPWRGGVVDEIANCKPDIWNAHLRPLFSTRGMKDAWCWLIGVPEGLNHFYDICEDAKSNEHPDWKFYHWISADILDPEEIEDAKRTMDPRYYRQEYEASFETATGRVYADYSDENHQNVSLDPGKEIVWTHDFNFTPLSSAILQVDENKVYMVDEIVLESAVAKNTALEFVERFKDYRGQMVKVYGDAQGHHGQKHGHKSDYMEIEEILKKNGFRVQIKAKRGYRPIKESQSSLRAKILNAAGERTFFVNAAKCKNGDKGLKLTQLKKGSSFQEADSEYQHITTALRYFTDIEFPIKSRGGISETSW